MMKDTQQALDALTAEVVQRKIAGSLGSQDELEALVSSVVPEHMSPNIPISWGSMSWFHAVTKENEQVWYAYPLASMYILLLEHRQNIFAQDETRLKRCNDIDEIVSLRYSNVCNTYEQQYGYLTYAALEEERAHMQKELIEAFFPKIGKRVILQP
jgi:hypothetical protein